MKELTQVKNIINMIKGCGKQYDFILAPARGGLIPAQFIAYALDIKTIHTINNIRGDYPRSQPNMKCLIVDDINDTGKTCIALQDYMLDNKLAESVDVAVIYERHSSEFEADYVGDIIYHDDWVEFTWDKEIVCE